jgi:sugar transferase (PEP-CTERM system associated)
LFRISRHYISGLLILTLVGDLGIILVSVGLAYWWLEWIVVGPIWPKLVGLISTSLLFLYLADLYNLQVRAGGRELCLRLGLALGSAAVVFAALGYAIPSLRFGRMGFATITTSSIVGLLLFRLMIRHLDSYSPLQKRILVLGTELADLIISYEGQNSRIPFRIVGFLDDGPDAYERVPPGYDLLGRIKDLLGVIEKLRPDNVLVALTDMRGTLPVMEILECRFRGIRVEDWTTFYEKLTGKIFVTGLRPSWLIFSDGALNTRLTDSIKRVFDVALSIIGLISSAPLMVLAALCIKLDSPGPCFFCQERVGQDGKVFTLYKLRSMRTDAEQATGPVWASIDDPRVTRVGRILRKTRLDETPQMLNVLLGQMSFIGPRPERPAFVNQLKEQIPFYIHRFSVKPGITGWAQVKYQYGSTVDDAMEKLQYDLYYIKNMSVFLDLLILLSSAHVVLFGKGAR